MKPLLIIGSSGQLARAFRTVCPTAIYLDRHSLDLSKPEKIAEILEAYDPSAVINTAAYTQVDNAEAEESLATIINAQGPTALAIYCSNRHIPFVHFSTDYVFDGSGKNPWRETDLPAPLNAYGSSKLKGEEAIAKVGRSYMIIRTSWLYDAQGKNFLNTILRLASEREELRIINDQFGAPTYTPHLAAGALALLEAAMQKSTFPSGIYHLCSGGTATWYDFAVQIVEDAVSKRLPVKTNNIVSITTEEYPLPAKRPLNSRLDCIKADSMFGVKLPSWQEGLAACMEQKIESR